MVNQVPPGGLDLVELAAAPGPRERIAFGRAVEAELDTMRLAGECRPVNDPPGCGRPGAEFAWDSDAWADEEAEALRVYSVRLAVRRWRCPCGIVWVTAAEVPQ